jgi:hypothetical protein
MEYKFSDARADESTGSGGCYSSWDIIIRPTDISSPSIKFTWT